MSDFTITPTASPPSPTVGRAGGDLLRQALLTALSRPRYEVVPLDGMAEQVAEWVPRHITVTVTASPRKGLDPTLAVVERLARLGYWAVPHLAARHVVDEAHLGEILRRLADAGVREAFVIAGDAERPVGRFTDALGLLTAMDRLGHDLEQVGIAGYPEGHPFISDEDLATAMHDKQPLATYLVSQMCFDAAAISVWLDRVRRQGVRLPIHVGIPGRIQRRKLLRIATKIGLGPSARFLRKHRHPVSRLVLPGGYRPDRLLRGLAGDLTEPERKIEGLHVYTLGEVRATERWRRQVLDRLNMTARR